MFGGNPFDQGLLLSAYDIHYRNVLDPDSLSRGFGGSVYALPVPLIVDTGWYEYAVGSDVRQPLQDPREPLDWNEDLYRQTIDRFDPEIRALVLSYDRHASYDAQLAAAREFFATRRHLASSILLKPPSEESQYHDFRRLVADAGALRGFDMVSVAEKDLGNTVIKRLKATVELRDLMDAADAPAPIHILGALDPLFTPLYFSAGAEVFDGLTWLRYAYHDGLCVHRDALSLIQRQIDKRDLFTISDGQLRNLDALRELKRDLQVFADRGEDWAVLRRGDLLQPAHEALLSEVHKRGR
jgi:hypothetical protein